MVYLLYSPGFFFRKNREGDLFHNKVILLKNWETQNTVEKWKIYSHRNIFPSNQLFSDLFNLVNALLSRKFEKKNRESKFP